MTSSNTAKPKVRSNSFHDPATSETSAVNRNAHWALFVCAFISSILLVFHAGSGSGSGSLRGDVKHPNLRVQHYVGLIRLAIPQNNTSTAQVSSEPFGSVAATPDNSKTCEIVHHELNHHQFNASTLLSPVHEIGLPGDFCTWINTVENATRLVCKSNVIDRLYETRDPVPPMPSKENLVPYYNFMLPQPNHFGKMRVAKSEKFPIRVDVLLPRNLQGSEIRIAYSYVQEDWIGEDVGPCDATRERNVILAGSGKFFHPDGANLAHVIAEMLNVLSTALSWRKLNIPKPTHMIVISRKGSYENPVMLEMFMLVRRILDCIGVKLITRTEHEMNLCGVLIKVQNVGNEWQWFLTPESVRIWMHVLANHRKDQRISECETPGNEILIFQRNHHRRGIKNVEALAEEISRKFPSNPVRVLTTVVNQNISTQIRRLCKARVVLTPHGAQETLFAFLPSHVGILEVIPSSWYKFIFVNLQYAMGRAFALQIYNSSNGSGSTFEFNSEDSRMLLDSLETFL